MYYTIIILALLYARTHRIALIIFEKACSNLRNLLSVHAG